MESVEYLTRTALARRWNVSLKHIDRLRFAGALPWLEVAPNSLRPTVRFRLCDVIEFEERGLHKGITDVNPDLSGFVIDSQQPGI
jgi:hypothetical protein